jgi:hypothetical protein
LKMAKRFASHTDKKFFKKVKKYPNNDRKGKQRDSKFTGSIFS